MPSEFAHAMRSAELALAMDLLPPRGRVLELGAGDGWQASMLAQHGFAVSAVDVASPSRGGTQYTPVTLYDGTTLPFANDTFDAVYSSNVLEHIKEFDRIQAELARVLKPGGVAIHCVPSSTWRFWTTVGHPFYALRWVIRSRKDTRLNPGERIASLIGTHKSHSGVLGLLRLGFVAPRHGEQGNLISEHYLFSRHGWSERLEHAGWRIVRAEPTHLFYTGNELFGLQLSNAARTRLSRVLGSSTRIFLMRPLSAGATRTNASTSA